MRIRIQESQINADPDPGEPNQSGSGSRRAKSMGIRIRNTVCSSWDQCFGHQNPGSRSVFSLKCWIRIRTQWIRIRTQCRSGSETLACCTWCCACAWRCPWCGAGRSGSQAGSHPRSPARAAARQNTSISAIFIINFKKSYVTRADRGL